MSKWNLNVTKIPVSEDFRSWVFTSEVGVRLPYVRLVRIPHEYRDDDHREDAPHFTIQNPKTVLKILFSGPSSNKRNNSSVVKEEES